MRITTHHSSYQHYIGDTMKLTKVSESLTTSDDMKENQPNLISTENAINNSTTIENKEQYYPRESNIKLAPAYMNGNTQQVISSLGPKPPQSASTPIVNREYQQMSNTEQIMTPSSRLDHTNNSPSSSANSSINSTPNNNSSEVDSSRSSMSISDSSIETPSPDSTRQIQKTIVPNGSTPQPALSALIPTSSSTPVLPQAPVRRRPGRPPGSTKKYKQQYADLRKKEAAVAQDEDFSLRKFFEAGGRDYNEYLDWLKKKQAQQAANNQLISQTAPAYTNLPSSVLPVSSGIQAPVTQVPPASLPSYAGHQPNSEVLPPPPYRGPVMIPSPSILSTRARPDIVSIQSLPQGYPMLTTVINPVQTPVQQQQPQQHHQQQLVQTVSHPAALQQSQDSNALDLSGPSSRKRRSEGSCSGTSSDEEVHSPTGQNKFFRDSSGSPVPITCRSPPTCRSPVEINTALYTKSRSSVSPQLQCKEDINGNVSMTWSHSSSDGQEVNETPDLSSWDVETVVRFILSIPGCQEYAEAFREHRIDGATLPHLSEEHLLHFVKMKLGPAIRLRLAIAKLKSANIQ